MWRKKMIDSINDYTEDNLENSILGLFKKQGWDVINGFDEKVGYFYTGRSSMSEVVLEERLKKSLEKLNPELPSNAIDETITKLTQDRHTQKLERANFDVSQLLKERVKITYVNKDGKTVEENVNVIDWENPENNDFYAVQQFWIQGKIYKRRADLVLFVNGLPLVFIELKAIHKRLINAFQNNLRDYKYSVPQIFWYNSFVVLSNGSKAKVGSISSTWEHFFDWKKLDDAGNTERTQIQNVVKGLCDKKTLLDYIENFTLFHETKEGLIKIVAKNHQYLGVNNAFQKFVNRDKTDKKLGVFWHTQGSGKSFSMIFLTTKILRKVPGNWTFVMVTDRQELDRQLYKNFANSFAITEPENNVHAKSSYHLKQLLTEDHRFVFTLIHKFTEPELISKRDDLIVIVDEAHRSQYATLAMNMRTAIPNASYIAFTGTPLIKGIDEETKNIFGDYVSIYNFKESVDDGATVKLYYENRIPELQVSDEINDKMEDLLEEAEITPEQEEKLEREFSKQYHLITREERLDKIAKDIVDHFMNRGFAGKAMVVSIDKATAIRMYNKVKEAWVNYLEVLKKEHQKASGEARELIEEKIAFMSETDMAVVVSQSQNEVADMKKKGLDILPHRERMLNEDLDKKFKDPDSNLRIVFICAMWITGFDVPSCSTIYLDKPMKNHTLMQTIARANRVYKGKENGLIVDYIGVFGNLKRALGIYATSPTGDFDRDTPIKNKDEIHAAIREELKKTDDFLEQNNIDFTKIVEEIGFFDKVALIDKAVDNLLSAEEITSEFNLQVNYIHRLYKALLPDPKAGQYHAQIKSLLVIQEKIRNEKPEVDIEEIKAKIEKILDDTINTTDYLIKTPKPLDLSQINFEKLQELFKQGQKRKATDILKRVIEQRMYEMIQKNRTRIDFLEKFRAMIEEYNNGSLGIEGMFETLKELSKQLDEEEKRSVKENLTEEELAVFDLLVKPSIELTNKEREQVKEVSQSLLEKLKAENLLNEGYAETQQGIARVKVAIMDELNKLPDAYDKDLYQSKCDVIFDHILSSYKSSVVNVYSMTT
jgi:type I restriction enzyme R subunit